MEIVEQNLLKQCTVCWPLDGPQDSKLIAASKQAKSYEEAERAMHLLLHAAHAIEIPAAGHIVGIPNIQALVRP